MTDQSKLNIDYSESKQDLTLTARLLDSYNQPIYPYQLVARVRSEDRYPAARDLISYIYRTLSLSQASLTPELVIQYGFWLVKLVERKPYHLELFELNESDQYIAGIERSLLYWHYQVQLSHYHQLSFSPANLQEVAIINKKIFEPGQSVLGIRNVRQSDHSGWILVTKEADLWDHDQADTMYLYDVIRNRSQLIHFFGLPMDTAFFLNEEGYKVWPLEA